MTVIALASAKGSPGVTTTALALTIVWPRPVFLIEADVVGGSSILAGWMRADVEHDRSLVDAHIAHRHGELGERLHSLTMSIPPSEADSTRRLLAAIPRSMHAAAVEPLWQPLADLAVELDDAGTDVIVDAGRLHAAHGPRPLLRAAGAVLVVARANLPAIAALAATLGPVKDDLAVRGTGDDTLALLTIGQPSPGPIGRLYSPREIRNELRTPVLGTISFDPASAAVFSDGAKPPRGFHRSALMRSTVSVADAAAHLAEEHAARLRAGPSADGREGQYA